MPCDTFSCCVLMNTLCEPSYNICNDFKISIMKISSVYFFLCYVMVVAELCLLYFNLTHSCSIYMPQQIITVEQEVESITYSIGSLNLAGICSRFHSLLLTKTNRLTILYCIVVIEDNAATIV